MGLNMWYNSSVYSSLIVCLVLGTLTGCNSETSPDDAIAAANSSNIKRVTNLYLGFQAQNNWVGPEDEAKFKDFVRSLSEVQLGRIGVDPGNLDETFVSERDGQPFKIRYKVVGSERGSEEPVVFEAEGFGGHRMVGFLNMTQRDVDSAEADTMFGSKGSTK